MLKKFKFWQKIVNEYSKEHDHSGMAKAQMVWMRQVIGFLGMVLPFAVAIIARQWGGLDHWPTSISETWHTNACTPFMIILGSAAFVLICYKGYGPIDDHTLSLAGIMALGVCLFPCKEGSSSAEIGTFMIDRDVSDVLHVGFAIAFFGLLAFTALCLFTLGKEEKTENKEKRNKIYRFCGWGMIVALLMIILCKVIEKNCEMDFLYDLVNRFRWIEFLMNSYVWLFETIALFCFGISFLTKANSLSILFCDECERKRKLSFWLDKIKQAVQKVS